MTSPYKCPVHLEWLVRRVFPGVKIVQVIANKRRPDAVSYYACPVKGCTFIRADKWQRKRIRNA
jgi:hypothetical protein